MSTLGKIGSRLTCPPGPFSEMVIRAESETPHGATWCIQLSAWQSTSSDGRSRTAVSGNLVARIEVGSEGGTDVFSVDYPAQGCAFSVQGQTLTVTLIGDGGLDSFGPNTSPRPVLGAWATVAASSTNHRATLTTNAETIAGSSSSPFEIPPRAQAYQVSFVSNTDGGQPLVMEQQSGHTPRRTLCNDVVLIQPPAASASTIPFWAAPMSRSRWYPLHPNAQAVSVINSGVNAATVYLTFFLDTAA